MSPSLRRAGTLFLAVALAVALGTASAEAATKKAPRPAKARAAVVTVAAPIPPPARNFWHEARAIADRGQPDSAIALLRPVIAENPAAFDLRWLEAGLTGEAGRPGDAVRLYEALSAEFPERAPELICDLGKERLRSDDAAGAARDLRACVAGHPADEGSRRRLALALAQADSLPQALAAYDALVAEDPHDVDLALDRARVLGWMGRHGRAIEAYAAVLERQPGLSAAKLGQAKNENWLGRHRRATRHLEELVGRADAGAETWKALAFARYWDDDPKGARDALAHHHALEPDDAEAQELATKIARESSPALEMGTGRSRDSEALVVSSPSVEIAWPLTMNLVATAAWRQDFTEDQGGANDARQLSAGLRQRFGPAWTAYARGTSLAWKSGRDPMRGGEAGLVLRPVDHVRLEVVTDREPVLTRIALDQGITLLSWTTSLDWEPSSRLAWHVDARAGSYSDGNRLERSAARVQWQVLDRKRWDVTAMLGVEQLNVHADLDHGYYDPDFHREWGPGLEIEWKPSAPWSLRGVGRTGWQRDKGGFAEPFYGSSGRLRWKPTEAMSASLEGGAGDSNLQSDAGYRREWVRLTVAKGF
jgi:Flp pilus assembly protein TadD